MKIFDLNGPLMDALRKFSDIVVYNLLFCLFSLPVITAGASLCALCEGMQLIASDRDSDLPVFKTFLKTFKKSFVSATLLWFVCIFCYFILVSVNYAAEIFKGKGLLRGNLESDQSIIDHPSFFAVSMGVGFGTKKLSLLS